MLTSSRSIIFRVVGAPVFGRHDGLEGNKFLHNKIIVSAYIGKQHAPAHIQILVWALFSMIRQKQQPHADAHQHTSNASLARELTRC